MKIYIVVMKIYIKSMKIYIVAMKIYIVATKIYIVATKIYIVATKIYCNFLCVRISPKFAVMIGCLKVKLFSRPLTSNCPKTFFSLTLFPPCLTPRLLTLKHVFLGTCTAICLECSFLNMGQTRPLFVYFCLFLNTITNIIQNLTIKAYMVCLGLEPWTTEW